MCERDKGKHLFINYHKFCITMCEYAGSYWYSIKHSQSFFFFFSKLYASKNPHNLQISSIYPLKYYFLFHSHCSLCAFCYLQCCQIDSGQMQWQLCQLHEAAQQLIAATGTAIVGIRPDCNERECVRERGG